MYSRMKDKILEDADQQATSILEDARAQARQEHDDLIAAGHASIERAVKKAKKELQAEVADIAILGAEKILQRSVNPDDHKKALNELAQDL